MTTSLRHRSLGLAEHLNKTGGAKEDSSVLLGSADADESASSSQCDTSSVATVKTTNRSSSKSKRFYLVIIILFAAIEGVLVAYYTVTGGLRSTGKGSTGTTDPGGEPAVAPVLTAATNFTSKIITVSNRAIRQGTIQRLPPKTRPKPKRWIKNEVGGLTELDARRLIVEGAKGPAQDVFDETVCDPESSVMRYQLSNIKTIDEIIMHLDEREDEAKASALISQLIYRAVHENQFGPARHSATNKLKDDPFNVECPDAKFLIFEGFTAPSGLGSHLRTRMAIPSFLSGLAHDRIVLYTKADEMTPMTIVNCERGDLQCSFLPMSPCMISQEYITSAPVISDNWDDYLRNHTELRVIKLSRSVERHFAAALQVGDQPGDKQLKIVENFWTPEQRGQRLDSLVKGVARIVARLYDATERTDDVVASFKRFMNGEQFESRVIAAAQLFITRPNRKMRSQIHNAIKSSFPAEYDPTKALGLPIRGSDKCLREQKCIDFGTLMKQVDEEFDLNYLSYLVITTEDVKYLDDAVIWKAMNGKQSSHLKLIMNKADVLQATGQFQYLPGNKSTPFEEIMVSTMAAWAMQLRAGQSFLNTCSNFHRLFEASIEFGCGAAVAWKRQHVECKVLV